MYRMLRVRLSGLHRYLPGLPLPRPGLQEVQAQPVGGVRLPHLLRHQDDAGL